MLRKSLIWLVLVVPVLAYGCFIYRLGLSLPFWDDLYVLNDFVRPIRQGIGLQRALELWLGRNDYNEHRIAFNRAVFGWIAVVSPPFDLRLGMVVGNLSLIGTAWLIGRNLYRLTGRLLLVLPVPFLFFTAQFYQNALWSTGSMSNLTVLFWVLLSFQVLSKGGPANTLAAFALSAVAMLTLNSGSAGFLVGAVVLLWRRQWTLLGSWLALTTLLLYWNSAGYTPKPWEPTLAQNIKYPLSILAGTLSFPVALLDLSQPVPWYFPGYELFGYWFEDPKWLVLFGALFWVMAGVLVFKIFTPYRQKTPVLPDSVVFFGATLAFALMVAVLAVLFRANGTDLSQVLTVKYRVYSAVALAAVYALAAWKFPARRRLWLLGCLALAFGQWGLAYWRYSPNWLNNRHALVADAYNFRQNGQILFYPSGIVTTRATQIMDTITRQGIYTLPRTALDLNPPPDTSATTSLRFSLRSDRDQTLIGSDSLWIPGRDAAYLLLRSATHRYALPLTARLSTFGQVLRTRQLNQAGGWARIPVPNLPPGTYRVGVSRTTPGEQNDSGFSNLHLWVPATGVPTLSSHEKSR